MNKFESRLNLEKLQAALTIVVGNDIIIPYIEEREVIIIGSIMHGYVWRYKKYCVKVDLNSIVNTEILEHGELDRSVEDIREYVKGELYRLINQEVKANAM